MNLNQTIAGHQLEYFDDGHIYLVDGIIVPSVTQIMKVRFGRKYDGIPSDVLARSADLGTKVHEAIYNFCVSGTQSDLPEVRNFEFLRKIYSFRVIGNEVPVILLHEGEPIAAGRLDLVIQNEIGEIGLADIKRTSTLDKDYLFYQLNLYRLAYRDSYGTDCTFLKGVHLKETTRKYVDIPVDDMAPWSIINEYLEANA